MLLDKAKRDMQVRGHESFVDIDRRSSLCRSERAMLRKHPRIVIHNPIAGRNLRPHDAFDFLLRRWPVQSGRNQNGDALRGDSGCVKTRQQRWQRH